MLGKIIWMGSILLVQTMQASPLLSHAWIKRDLLTNLTTSHGPGSELMCMVSCWTANCFGFAVLSGEEEGCLFIDSKHLILLGADSRNDQTTVDIWVRHIRFGTVFGFIDNGAITNYYLDDSIQFPPIQVPDLPELLQPMFLSFPGFVFLCSRNTQECFKWIIGTSNWTPSSPMLHKHIFTVEVTKMGGSYWIIGGVKGGNEESHGLSEYLSSDGKWRNGSVNHPGVFTGLASISDHELFVIGGATSLVSAWRNSAHVLDIRTQAKREVGGGLPFAMMHTSCTRFRLKNGTEVVLCVGGRCDSCQPTLNVQHNLVIVFNIEHEWLMLKPEWDLPVRGRAANLFVSRDGILYLLGGSTFKTNSFQFNEGGSPVWIPIHPVPNADDFMAFEISYIRT